MKKTILLKLPALLMMVFLFAILSGKEKAFAAVTTSTGGSIRISCSGCAIDKANYNFHIYQIIKGGMGAKDDSGNSSISEVTWGESLKKEFSGDTYIYNEGFLKVLAGNVQSTSNNFSDSNDPYKNYKNVIGDGGTAVSGSNKSYQAYNFGQWIIELSNADKKDGSNIRMIALAGDMTKAIIADTSKSYCEPYKELSTANTSDIIGTGNESYMEFDADPGYYLIYTTTSTPGGLNVTADNHAMNSATLIKVYDGTETEFVIYPKVSNIPTIDLKVRKYGGTASDYKKYVDIEGNEAFDFCYEIGNLPDKDSWDAYNLNTGYPLALYVPYGKNAGFEFGHNSAGLPLPDSSLTSASKYLQNIKITYGKQLNGGTSISYNADTFFVDTSNGYTYTDDGSGCTYAPIVIKDLKTLLGNNEYDPNKKIYIEFTNARLTVPTNNANALYTDIVKNQGTQIKTWLGYKTDIYSIDANSYVNVAKSLINKDAAAGTGVTEATDASVFDYGLVLKINDTGRKYIITKEDPTNSSATLCAFYQVINNSGNKMYYITDWVSGSKIIWDGNGNITSYEDNEGNTRNSNINILMQNNGTGDILNIMGLGTGDYTVTQIEPSLDIKVNILPEHGQGTPYTATYPHTDGEGGTSTASEDTSSYTKNIIEYTNQGSNKVTKTPLTVYEDTTNSISDNYVLTAEVELKYSLEFTLPFPETGGIGTLIFYIAGGIIVAFSMIFLIIKRRMPEEY